MIKNSLKYTKNNYTSIEKINIAFEYLNNNNLKDFKNGKYNIQGEDIYINIQDYDSKPESLGKWEAHRKYIDIQFIIEGSEKIGVGEIQNFKTTEPYSEENDVEFLSIDEEQQFITMKENDYIILYPHDVHMPQIAIDKPSYVKKAVIKIKA